MSSVAAVRRRRPYSASQGVGPDVHRVARGHAPRNRGDARRPSVPGLVRTEFHAAGGARLRRPSARRVARAAARRSRVAPRVAARPRDRHALRPLRTMMALVRVLPRATDPTRRARRARWPAREHRPPPPVPPPGRLSTMMQGSPRERLRELILDLAVVRGRVTLSSGREADYYIDLRRVTLHHEGAPLVGHLLSEQLDGGGPRPGNVDAVGGLTLGPTLSRPRCSTRRRREGAISTPSWCARRPRTTASSAGSRDPTSRARRVVVVEDTSTTGEFRAHRRRRAARGGRDVLAVAVIVDRETRGARGDRGRRASRTSTSSASRNSVSRPDELPVLAGRPRLLRARALCRSSRSASSSSTSSALTGPLAVLRRARRPRACRGVGGRSTTSGSRAAISGR